LFKSVSQLEKETQVANLRLLHCRRCPAPPTRTEGYCSPSEAPAPGASTIEIPSASARASSTESGSADLLHSRTIRWPLILAWVSPALAPDRKSTRLNSSHVKIS